MLHAQNLMSLTRGEVSCTSCQAVRTVSRLRRHSLAGTNTKLQVGLQCNSARSLPRSSGLSIKTPRPTPVASHDLTQAGLPPAGFGYSRQLLWSELQH